MADKGGKGYTPARKSSDGSSKSKKGKGKQVHFEDSEDSLETINPDANGTADTPSANGGKGDKAANGSKKSRKKATTPVEPKIDQELPPQSLCLMDCEAGEILQGIQEQMVLLSQDPDIKLPVSFDMGLSYAKRSTNPAKPDTVKKLLEPLKMYGVSETEICHIVNVCPESVDEVFSLIPSLKPKMSKLRDPLRFALDEISHLKESLANLSKSRA